MVTELRPHPGPQTAFLSTSADIGLYGGGAGGGKTWGELLEPLRHIKNSRFTATFFRRSYPQIKNPGGLWDASTALYPLVGAVPRHSAMKWLFPSGAYAVFRPLKFQSSVLEWQGTELPFVALDELTHFTAFQFWYLVSRMRSTCGVEPYMRATCNPDPDSFVRELIDWWIDEDTGFAISERSGVIRHLVRDSDSDRIDWFDEPQFNDDGEKISKSFTFITASVYDNPTLLSKDPGYLANLRSQPLVERERLLHGNWNVKSVAGKVFRSDWFKVINEMPRGDRVIQSVRFWDFAATERAIAAKRGNDDPDWTVGVRLDLLESGKVVWSDTFRDRLGPDQVERAMLNTASQDGTQVRQAWFTDPGQAGNYQTERLQKLLRGYDRHGVTGTMARLDKVTRAAPLSRGLEFGEVLLLAAPWNSVVIAELVAFPDGPHDDIVDAGAGAYLEITDALPRFGQSRFR